MICENFKTCPFYNDKMDIESGLGKMYKAKYCEGDKTKCARYILCLELGKELVPVDLFPNMHDQAQKILKEHGK